MHKSVLQTTYNSRHELKLATFKEICKTLSVLSYDPKYKVAAIIITDDFREICAIGYNGNFKGGPNTRDSTVQGGSGFLHAEENALLHLTRPFEARENLIIICTHKPCAMCAKRIANSGIKRVFYINDYTDSCDPQLIFDTAGITVKKI
jgi:dCMP deaminase